MGCGGQWRPTAQTAAQRQRKHRAMQKIADLKLKPSEGTEMRDWSATYEKHEGRTRRTHRVWCHQCGSTTAIHGMDFGGKTACTEMPKKFEARGWSIGRRMDEDKCPACVLAEKQNKTAKVIKMQEVKAVAEPPREPTRAELRNVQDALDEAYPQPERGYKQGESDEALAKKLGYPKDWVRRVREQFFGPEHDVDLRRIEIEIEAVRRDAKAIEDSTLMAVDSLSKRVEALIRTLDGMRAQLRGAA